VPEMDIAGVQLRQVRDDLGRDATFVADEPLDLRDESGVG